MTQKYLLNVREVAERTSLSTRSIWRMVSTGTFPKPVQLGARTTRWRSTDIEDFVTSLKGGEVERQVRR